MDNDIQIEICYGGDYELDHIGPIENLYFNTSEVGIPDEGLYKQKLEYLKVNNGYHEYEFNNIHGYRIYDYKKEPFDFNYNKQANKYKQA